MRPILAGGLALAALGLTLTALQLDLFLTFAGHWSSVPSAIASSIRPISLS